VSWDTRTSIEPLNVSQGSNLHRIFAFGLTRKLWSKVLLYRLPAMRYPPHISVPHTIRYPVWGTRTGGGRTRLRNPTSTGLLTRAVLTRVHMAHTCLCATVCLLSCWNCTMELYGGPPPNMVYAWQSNVYLEELMYGLAWPAVARVRHRPQYTIL
jgi:hypothetical protein